MNKAETMEEAIALLAQVVESRKHDYQDVDMRTRIEHKGKTLLVKREARS